MRASFLMGAERRDLAEREGIRPRRPRRKASAADVALRSGNPYCDRCGREVFVSAGEPTHIHSPQDFVTSPDGGGRRRLLERFWFANWRRA